MNISFGGLKANTKLHLEIPSKTKIIVLMPTSVNFSKYTTFSVKQTQDDLKTSINSGLNEEEVKKRQKEFGKNSLEEKNVGAIKIFANQFKSSFIYLLIAAAGLAFVLGEKLDAAMIILFVTINTILGFYQEYRSERSIKLLKQYTVSKSKVIRNGQPIAIDSTEIVPGDVVLLEAGDVIPADTKIIKEHDFAIDESVLTGESITVRKISNALQNPETQAYKALNIAFSGTSVISGKAMGLVIATGKDTEMGKIAKLTVDTFREDFFQKESTKLSSFILKLVLITLAFLFIFNITVRGAKTNITELIIFSVALAVSVIPEALPTVITFALSKGALDLAKHKVVVKRLSAIHDLGSIEILCTDKTGTITENKLTISDIFSPDKKKTLFYAALANFGDSSFDTAIEQKLTFEEKQIIKNIKRLDEIPFDPERKRNSVLVQLKSVNELIVRGAPEIVMMADKSLDSQLIFDIKGWVSKKGLEGNRVIAIAHRNFNKNPKYGKSKYSENDEVQDLKFLGLIAFHDPIKRSAIPAIRKAEHLGVQIKILTGDSMEIAGAVGHKVGLIKKPQLVILGDELDKLSEAEFTQTCQDYHVFARLSPLQKFKVIKALKKSNEVGFLGEGINDAPALKAANVAIAVQDASNIARESSDIILLGKGLDVIIDGIMEGRMVFTNTTKYIKATLASNFGNFYAIVISTLFIDYLPMLPLQLLLLNLLSDFPMISIASDNVDPNEVKFPPKSNFKEFAFLATVLGLVSTVFDLTFFGIFSRMGTQILQTAWFMGSVLTELAFIYSIRTKQLFYKAKRPSLIIVVLTILAGISAIGLTLTNFGNEVFKFTNIGTLNIMSIFGIVFLYFICTEAVKIFYYKEIYRPSEKKKMAVTKTHITATLG